MKKIYLLMCGAIVAGSIFNSCKKSSGTETVKVSTPPLVIGQALSDTTSGGPVKGTMLSGKTYNISRDMVVPIHDTLYLQSGVTVCISNNACIVIQGILISIGTQTNPNYFTVCSGAAPMAKNSSILRPATDIAWNNGKGWWPGIQCDTSCTLCCVKWTHIEYVGSATTVNEPFDGGSPSSTNKGILFQNHNGDLIIEDSWMYGTIDDAVRISDGRISIMRNTFEKCGYIGGDVLNAKGGSYGDMAYNLFVGTATNGTKASSKGAAIGENECQINMFNNTYVNGGYRQTEVGRGANIDFEQSAQGMAYNNLIVNCKFGMRVVGPTPNAPSIPMADTSNLTYGYNYGYGDSASVVNQLYPVGYITRPIAYVVPNPASTNYIYMPVANGANSYDASALVGMNKPVFANFPLPEAQALYEINCVGSYSFKLQSSSPALGKGTTNFSALAVTKVTKVPYAAVITQPGLDMGCYQNNGNGNQH
jgi:hypothetical protein